ncbi:unnamed protein product [Didymodactylos carnosus]|uniref:Uncharacterized protein n=1 Tax=Didymodactylos carnosus TaxID=1234261 RepID=A0A814D6E0_9BILA|nr:unnamed protein product [Didymodactylos carnosus]CAF1133369.1 unnamed protein product [Didymodactylos carnosus]CAF3725764.1 unnamed protein product [Didymodactylos carnosus]CAF3919608.1 unnamed protein product [Didymodactylos carnosus]
MTYSGFFPAYDRRKTNVHIRPSNYYPHLHVKDEKDTAITTTSFLPPIDYFNRPYRRNDFCNNNLFVTKRKLAQVFLGQHCHSAIDLADLLNVERKTKKKPKRHLQEIVETKPNNLSQQMNSNSTTSISVINLVIKPPYSDGLMRTLNKETSSKPKKYAQINSITAALKQLNANAEKITTIKDELHTNYGSYKDDFDDENDGDDNKTDLALNLSVKSIILPARS